MVRFLLLFLLLFNACAPKMQHPGEPVSYLEATKLHFADDGNEELLRKALLQNKKYFASLEDIENPITVGPYLLDKEKLEGTSEKLLTLLGVHGLGPSFEKALACEFDTFEVRPDDLLVTGYFEAALSGSRKQSKRYSYPLYKRPPDMYELKLSDVLPESEEDKVFRVRVASGRVVPYYSRREIDIEKELANRDLEIVWVDDPIKAFFLHIQGSGTIFMDTGEQLQVSYADKNGHPYRALGRELVRRGLLTFEEVSMQSIERVLRTKQETLDDILAENPSYIFFDVVEEGPRGALGVPVTEGRSVALDHSLFPKGAVMHLQAELPWVGRGEELQGKLSRIVLNQDTGGAIKGRSRVDFFLGTGEKNELLAGHLKHPGKLSLLIAKESPCVD